MNPLLRELLTDLKAAALIGHPDSLQSALDGIRALDDDQLPPSALLPLGRALTPLPAKTLKPLFVDDDPAIRAVVSVALGERYMQGKDVTAQDLGIPAEDPNPEVRTALARALIEFTPPRPEKFTPLVESWLQPPQNGVAPLPSLPALFLLPQLSPAPFHLFSDYDSVEDHALRDVLLTCLNTLAEKGHTAAVLDLLSKWAARPKPNVWVITRALSASWAQHYPEQATRILNTLAAQAGMIRPIVRALERYK
ncbi:MAG: hypothetical protein Fur0022_45520 [Anaerolineales bacterium]